jgi:outer membrane protein assembly factor BamB
MHARRSTAARRRLFPFVGLALAAWTVVAAGARADDWPQWLGPQRDGIWREKGILAAFPKEGPTIRWRTPIGAGYSGPAVADGRVFITDRKLAAGANNPDSGFARNSIQGSERVHCLDEKTGKILWTHEYDCPYQISYPAGPRTTPIVSGGKVYTLGAMGDLLCLDAMNGKVLWSKNFPRDYQVTVPLWGFAASPLLDGDRLICLVGGPGHVAVAFHKDTGKELWRALSAREPGYAPPMIYEVAGKRQLIVWHPESVNSLDPETGKVYWSQPFGAQPAGPGRKMLKAALSIPTPRLMGDLLFVTAFYDGSLMLKLDTDRPGASVLWESTSRSEQPDRTDFLHSIMSTPVLKDGYIYGVCSYGELRCLDAKTGQRIWSTRQPTGGAEVRWANAFLTPQGDRTILFNEHGDLIIAKLSPKGYEEISRANILTPTNRMAGAGRRVIWSHPAYADRCVFARNDNEIVCVSMAESGR